jgi:hypothetical protein
MLFQSYFSLFQSLLICGNEPLYPKAKTNASGILEINAKKIARFTPCDLFFVRSLNLSRHYDPTPRRLTHDSLPVASSDCDLCGQAQQQE